MRRVNFGVAIVVAGLAAASAAVAEPWVDYAPAKGAYVKTMVRVEPDKIDTYMVALKKTWIPGAEARKKLGVIDSYSVQVNENRYAPGPNVALIEHYPSLAAMEPDRARDTALLKESQKITPPAEVPAMQAERAKYRTIVSEDTWRVIDFSGK